jgi:sulfoxide reductase heme-binding subunit YedZ
MHLKKNTLAGAKGVWMSMARFFSFRLGTHVVSLLVLAGLARFMWPDFAAFPPMETWSMVLGYLSFVLITLLIGPIKNWLPPRWARACLSIRRDLGIWAGLTGFLHVMLVLVLFSGEPRLMIFGDTESEKAKGWLGLFFLASESDPGGPLINWSLTGIANYMGLVAFLILLSLWLTSSGRAEKWLGGSTWKRLHLANPLLFILVIFHGLIYINSIKGEPHSFADFLWLAAFVWLMRSIGFFHAVIKRSQK